MRLTRGLQGCRDLSQRQAGVTSNSDGETDRVQQQYRRFRGAAVTAQAHFICSTPAHRRSRLFPLLHAIAAAVIPFCRCCVPVPMTNLTAISWCEAELHPKSPWYEEPHHFIFVLKIGNIVTTTCMQVQQNALWKIVQRIEIRSKLPRKRKTFYALIRY